MEVSGQIHTPVFYLREEARGTVSAQGFMGPRTGLDAVEMRNICPSVTIPTELSRIHTSLNLEKSRF
jgi:hypothetical protein